MTDCLICDRYFEAEYSLEQHFRSKHPRCYCARCQRVFTSIDARAQHVAQSLKHNICEICQHRPDFPTSEVLNEHLERQHNRCVPCKRNFDSPSHLTQHDVDVHNLCDTCDKYFDSRSHLKNHAKRHASKKVSCLGCPQRFISDSALVLHLETGTCESGADSDRIDEIAMECYQSDRYQRNDGSGFDYECPCCETPFAYMSGLLQHAESDACDEQVSRGTPLGKFMYFLRTWHRDDYLECQH